MKRMHAHRGKTRREQAVETCVWVLFLLELLAIVVIVPILPTGGH